MTRLVLLALAALGALVAAFAIDARRIDARLNALDDPEPWFIPMGAEWSAPFAIKPESWNGSPTTVRMGVRPAEPRVHHFPTHWEDTIQ